MQKGKSFLKNLVKFVLVLGLITGIIFVLFKQNIFVNIVIQLKKERLDSNCSLPVVKRKDKHIQLVIYFDKSDDYLNQIEYYIILQDKKIKLTLQQKDWIKLYFMDNNAIQLKYLSRLWQQNQICNIEHSLIYLTGIVPDSIVVVKSGKYYVYPHTTSILIGTDIDETLDLPQDVTVLEDGSKIKIFSFNSINPIIQQYIQDTLIFNEGVNIELFNATNKSGYATFWGRVLTGLGFRVTHISTLNYLHGKTNGSKYLMYVNPKFKDYYSISVLRKLFGNDLYLLSARPKGILSTADVVIILAK